MPNQQSLCFPKKLIELLKERASNEKTSINALAERYLVVSLKTSFLDEDWLRLTSQPDETVHQLYQKIILGETFGHQTVRRAELRFIVEMAHKAYRDASPREYVRLSVLETLLEISFELLIWRAENCLPVNGHYIKQIFEFETENWREESARFMRELNHAVDPGYAEYLLRPLVSCCFSLADFPDDMLARIFTLARLKHIFPLLMMHTRQWSKAQHNRFIRDMRPLVMEMNEMFTTGDLRFDIRVDGRHLDLHSAVSSEVPCLYLVVTGSNFIMSFGWLQFTELYRVLKIYRTEPDAVHRYGQGAHISLALPGVVHKDAILGFDALRVFMPTNAFEELVKKLTERVEKGQLAVTVEALRTLYGDL